ncbi:MAG: zinc-ribbon domain containing protein [Patescibacteria group bacterium]|nr:zinc-ribbon domain containing protein [Patescibacteria group bacterium]
MSTCQQCNAQFEITGQDLQFYDEVSPVFSGKKYLIPEPKLCPDCRQQRRLTWRNEIRFWKRKCDATGVSMLSMYPPEAKLPVYENDYWLSDKWDAMEYGRDFDFNRPFFEQFQELRDQVPIYALGVLKPSMENSDYCNQAGYLKNCYLVFNTDNAEQCLYGKAINHCFNCVDCYKTTQCQSCYETMHSTNCSFSTHLYNCETCDDCHFGSNLIGCSHCFGSTNMHSKQYYFFNEKLDKAVYENKVAEMRNKMSDQEIFKKFQEFQKTKPTRWMLGIQNENTTGNYISQSKDCTECYDSEFLEKCKYCFDVKKSPEPCFNNHDINYFGLGIKNSYEALSIGYEANHVLFGFDIWPSAESTYCGYCTHNSQYIFGCAGLKKKEYCIFNKQYSKEDYEKLAGRIAEHMQKTNEWGEFFPAALSPFAYNQATALDYFPLTKDEVIAKGWRWQDEKTEIPKVERIITFDKLSVLDDITKVPDEILKWAIECKETKRPFMIQKLELEFYRKMNLPIPHFHPDVRYQNRLKLRQPRKLYHRVCDHEGCQVEFDSAYSPSDSQKVYCEKCYQEVIE